MPITDAHPRPLQLAALAASSLAIGLAAISSSGASAAPVTAATGGAAGSAAAAASDARIPYVSVLQPQAVRRHGKVVGGRIRLRGLIGADELKTRWSIRTIHRHGDQIEYRVVARGTVAPDEEAKRISAVVFGKRGSVVNYDITATNSAGGQPTPAMHARIARG
jgi:hypothetical protein